MRLYIFKGDWKDTSFIKVGVAKNPSQRLKQVQTGCPVTLKNIFSSSKTQHAFKIESEIHSIFAKYKTQGEWFAFKKHKANSIIKSIKAVIHFKTNDFELFVSNSISSGNLTADNMWRWIDSLPPIVSKEYALELILPRLKSKYNYI